MRIEFQITSHRIKLKHFEEKKNLTLKKKCEASEIQLVGFNQRLVFQFAMFLFSTAAFPYYSIISMKWNSRISTQIYIQ